MTTEIAFQFLCHLNFSRKYQIPVSDVLRADSMQAWFPRDQNQLCFRGAAGHQSGGLEPHRGVLPGVDRLGLCWQPVDLAASSPLCFHILGVMSGSLLPWVSGRPNSRYLIPT